MILLRTCIRPDTFCSPVTPRISEHGSFQFEAELVRIFILTVLYTAASCNTPASHWHYYVLVRGSDGFHDGNFIMCVSYSPSLSPLAVLGSHHWRTSVEVLTSSSNNLLSLSCPNCLNFFVCCYYYYISFHFLRRWFSFFLSSSYWFCTVWNIVLFVGVSFVCSWCKYWKVSTLTMNSALT